jgi:hypothetical protein
MGEEVSYELATARWRRTATVQIISVLDTEIGDFPLSFLSSCGDNTWQYILDTVQQLVDAAPDHPGNIFQTSEDGQEVDEVPVAAGETPVAGDFRFRQLGTSSNLLTPRYTLDTCFRFVTRSLRSILGLRTEPTFARGPEYYSRFKSPLLLPGGSSASASSQTAGRPEQVRTR